MGPSDQLPLSEDHYLALMRQAHLGAVAAAALHEFNNLATPVLMRAQDALERDEPAALRQSAESTLRNIRKALSLSEQLLSLTKPAGQVLELIALGEVVDDALAVLGRPLEKDRIEVRREIAADLRVRANRLLFEQLLIHLLMEIKGAIVGRGGRLSIKAANEGPNAVLDLEITGQHCTREFVEGNWSPFLDTTRQPPPLIGAERELPLRACRLIADACGIEIIFTPREPQGCLVRLRMCAS